MNGFLAVAKKELTHLLRDRTSLVMALLMPLIQVTLYGFAIDFDVRHISSVLVDLDHSRESREYTQKLRASQYLDFDHFTSSTTEAADMVRAGTARVAVIIPPDFSRKLAGGENSEVGVLVDGSDSQVALRARSAFTQAPTQSASGIPVAKIDVLFNPNMKTSNFMIPGLIGLVLQIILVSLTSSSIVREREQGSLEQLMVTPVGKYALMLGKLTPYFGLALVEMMGILAYGVIVFDVHVAGSLALLTFMSLPFILGSLALGLLISTIAQNQSQALQFTMLTMMPTILMSGFIFPRETMPGALYLASTALPLTHELNILRGVVVRGAGFMELFPSFAATSIIAALIVILATRKFQKSIA